MLAMPPALKVFLSLLAMFAPILVEYFAVGRKFEKARLKYYGISFIATGITTGIGAKFLGLAVAGRNGTVMVGNSAVAVSFLLIGFGLILISAHAMAFL